MKKSRDSAEITIDDLLADGEKNSREKEQGRDDEDERRADTDSACRLRFKQRAAVKPPFRMEIVEAQDVREVLFDADTGKPIRDTSAKTPADPRCRPLPSSCQPIRRPARRAGRRAATPSKMLDDFPIDFDGRNSNDCNQRS